MIVDNVDMDRLRVWLDAQSIGSGPLTDIEPVRGGSQNILIAFTRAGRRMVLRRPPPTKRAESDFVMRREARILSALDGTAVPFPRLIAACEDDTVLGCAFHVSEFVDGFTFWGAVPEPWVSDPDAVHQCGLEVVAAFGALARVDHDAVGLSDLGKTDWLQRQPDRWRRQLDSYQKMDGLGGERLAGATDVHHWLNAHMPGDEQVGLVHGDAHLGNVMVRNDGAGVAIVDWELCTVGDPRLDLGELLVTWAAADGPYAERATVPGLPSADEVVSRWARVSGREPASLSWFRVLAAYRLAVLLEGTYARARAGRAPMSTGELLHKKALALLAVAREGNVRVGF